MPRELSIVTVLALAAVFATSGSLKLVRPGSLGPLLAEFHVQPKLAERAATVVGSVELGIAAALALGVEGAWVAAAIVLIAFSGVLLVAVYRGVQARCGCFGDVSTAPVGFVHVARNCVFIAGAVLSSGAPSARPVSAVPAALAMAALGVFVPESAVLLRDFRRSAAEEIAAIRGERKEAG